MSMKSWVLHRVQGIGAAAGRADLPSHSGGRGREPGLDPDAARAASRAASPSRRSPTSRDLGIYAPLIRALRDELEHFVASQVRLHVAIADRDWFTLTAIGVRSPGGAASRELLQRFMQEFRPEQVKRYLAREVIGRLPNAARDRPVAVRRPVRPRGARARRRRRVPRAAGRAPHRARSGGGAAVRGQRPRPLERERPRRRRAALGQRVTARCRRRRSPAGAASSRSTTATVRARRC